MTISKDTQAFPRPLLHHLNADSSWLLQIPNSSTLQNERRYFNILIDPWLKGPQSDVASWFSRQWHAIPSKYQTIQEVSNLAWQAEPPDCQQSDDEIIDAITVCHEFTDHCHKETLLEVHSSVPVFAPDKAAALIRSWNHFDIVVETPIFSDKSGDWQTLDRGESDKGAVLPEWVRIGRVVEQNNALYYHSAVVILFESTKKSVSVLPLEPKDVATSGITSTKPNTQDTDSSTNTAGIGSEYVGQNKKATAHERDSIVECVIYTPHGIAPSALASPFASAMPKIETLCLLHGLHDVSLNPVQQLNLGAHNGLQVQRALKPKYWVGTHDEVKRGGGLVSWFLARKIFTLQDAFEKEKLNMDIKVSDDAVVHFMEADNGESIVLS